MPDYDLGTARGRIEIDSTSAEKGLAATAAGTAAVTKSGGAAASSMLLVGGAMTAVGVAGLAGFGLAIKAASDFEHQMSGVQAVSGATATEMEKLRKKALQLGADTVFSAGESAGAMEELVKAGLTVDDVLNGAADATVALAAAGEIDLPVAATIAANAMNQFNLAAQDLPHVADLIAGAANASAIDVSDFGLSMQQAGVIANLVGLSFDDPALPIAEDVPGQPPAGNGKANHSVQRARPCHRGRSEPVLHGRGPDQVNERDCWHAERCACWHDRSAEGAHARDVVR